MKSPILLSAFAAICAGLICISTGCRKILNNEGDVTIRGKLVQDCSGKPVALMPLEFYLKSDNTLVGGESGTIGHATTDLDGNFTVTGRNYGPGGLTVRSSDDRGFQFVYDYAISGGEGAVVDLGTVYDALRSSLTIKFARPVNNPQDSLFIGIYRQSPLFIAAGSDINGHTYQKVSNSSGHMLPYTEPQKFVWGIGMAEYRRAVDSMEALKNTPNAQFWHLITVRPGVCVDDTAFVSL